MLRLESLFRDLNDRGGRYVVVGGLAVVLHGHLRATGDVDLVVDLEPEQVARTLSALQAAGFQPYVPVPSSDFADPAKRATWAREKGMLVFSLRPAGGVPMVDLFLEPPMPFPDLWSRAVTMDLRGGGLARTDDGHRDRLGSVAQAPSRSGSGRKARTRPPTISIGSRSPLPGHPRRDIWFSGGLGYGSLGCNDCGGRDGGLGGGVQ